MSLSERGGLIPILLRYGPCPGNNSTRKGFAIFPITGRHYYFTNGIFLMLRFQTQVCPDPDALFFIRIDFAPTLKAAAAGSIPLVFRTLRNRAQITHIK